MDRLHRCALDGAQSTNEAQTTLYSNHTSASTGFETGTYNIHLDMALTPLSLKKPSLPFLELSAIACASAQLPGLLERLDNLGFTVPPQNTMLFTDSLVAAVWLRSQEEFSRRVDHRVTRTVLDLGDAGLSPWNNIFMFDQKTFPFPADTYTKRSKSKHVKTILQEFEDARNPPFLHLPIEQWPISRTLAIPKTCTATSLDLESKNEVSLEAAVSALQDAKQPALETVLLTKQTSAAHTVAEPEFSRRLVASRFYSVENCAPTRVMGVIFYYCDKLLHLSKKIYSRKTQEK